MNNTVEIPGAMQARLHEVEVFAHLSNMPPQFTMNALERQIIVAALERNKQNQCKAARALGWHRSTIRRRMSALQIPVRVRRDRKKKAGSVGVVTQAQASA